jgi:hypothetical protein
MVMRKPLIARIWDHYPDTLGFDGRLKCSGGARRCLPAAGMNCAKLAGNRFFSAVKQMLQLQLRTASVDATLALSTWSEVLLEGLLPLALG